MVMARTEVTAIIVPQNTDKPSGAREEGNENMNPSPIPNKFIILLVILSLASSLIPVHSTPYDYGYVSHAAERVFHGEILYRDFVHYYSPGHVYGPALFYLIFGITTYSLVLYWAFFNVLICITLFYISKHIWNNRLFIHFLPIMYIFFVQPSLYVGSDRLFFPILTTLLIYNYYRRGNKIWLYLSGLSLSAAYLFSYEVAFLETFPFIIFIVIKSGVQENRFIPASFIKNINKLISELAIFITGVLTLAVPVFLYFLVKAGYRDMFYWLVWVPLVPYSKYLSIPLSGYFTHLSIDKLVEGFSLYLEIIVYSSFIVYLIYKLILQRHFSARNLNLFLILLFGLFLFKIATVRSDHTHFMFAVLPAFILFAFSTIEMMRLLKKKYSSRLLRAFANIVFLVIIICMSVYGEYEWVMYFHRPSDYGWLQPERGHILMHKKWVDDLNGVVKYAVGRTEDSDYIFVIPAEAYIYFLSRRKNPTKNDSYHKGELILVKQAEAIKNLEEKKPKLIIFGGIYKLEFSEYYKLILSYIYDNYQLTEKIGRYEVYTPRAYGDFLKWKSSIQSLNSVCGRD
jgi:hypothetical protein